jgi:hypothetical protein
VQPLAVTHELNDLVAGTGRGVVGDGLVRQTEGHAAAHLLGHSLEGLHLRGRQARSGAAAVERGLGTGHAA